MKFNIIGGGRLGKTIAQTLHGLDGVNLAAICSEKYLNAEMAIAQIGSGIAVADLNKLPFADLTFITTPDDRIAQLAQYLAQEKIIAPQTIVAHCSGVLPSTILTPLKELGCQIASIHPLKAFRWGNPDKAAFRGCDCVIEGDEGAVEKITSLFKRLEARVIPIKAESKTLYHAAAVIASNYLLTLAAAAIELFDNAGIPEDIAKQMVVNLMTSSLGNIQQTANLPEALTGPLQRGDLNTLKMHLNALPRGEIKDLYCSAGLATLPLTTLSNEQKLQVQALLGD
ncbi:hypothetical protein BN59_00456 [Legionella massiliensis]|uniref:DUF2520 domain-containing protein n=1 Tax=Legionella massiliensis TaxID=1034943 RepID=A0A078KP75_9GAMM|nr:Rossmann-like and DUF2520 domain-containing protein [Legionella massiliensis]CDZ76190.1 hypothetical protein BN59_00456 [Legionella massiliensis]CEE11928.1 Rossmann-like domain protein [Legionella massiliensis]